MPGVPLNFSLDSLSGSGVISVEMEPNQAVDFEIAVGGENLNSPATQPAKPGRVISGAGVEPPSSRRYVPSNAPDALVDPSKPHELSDLQPNAVPGYGKLAVNPLQHVVPGLNPWEESNCLSVGEGHVVTAMNARQLSGAARDGHCCGSTNARATVAVFLQRCVRRFSVFTGPWCDSPV